MDHPVPVARNGAPTPLRPIYPVAATDRHARQHATRRRSRSHALPHLFAEMPESRIAPAHTDRRIRQDLYDPDPRGRRRRRGIVSSVVACAAPSPPVSACRSRQAVARAGHPRWIQQAQQSTFENIVVCEHWLCHIYGSPRIERACAANTTANSVVGAANRAALRRPAPHTSFTLKRSLGELISAIHQPLVDARPYQGVHHCTRHA